MKLEKERSSIKITYMSDSAPDEIRTVFDELCAKVEGIYLPSDIQKSKEGIVFNIRHRESLKTFLSKNIFRIDDYIEMLKRIQKYYAALSRAGFDPSLCIWDVDAVFIGNSVSDMEVVYLANSSESEYGPSILTDFLAIVSLHVFDSRDSALDALTEIVKEFAEFGEKEQPVIYPASLFERSINTLEAYSSGSGRIRQYVMRAENLLSDFISEQKERIKKISSGTDKKKKKPFLLKPVSDPVIGSFSPGWLEKRRIPNFAHDVEKDNILKQREKAVIEEDRDKYYEGESGATIPVGRDYAVELFGKSCPFVSRIHAAFIPDGKNFIITDKGSLNGTFLNGEQLKGGFYYKLEKGDIISLAHRELSFTFTPKLRRGS